MFQTKNVVVLGTGEIFEGYHLESALRQVVEELYIICRYILLLLYAEYGMI